MREPTPPVLSAQDSGGKVDAALVAASLAVQRPKPPRSREKAAVAVVESSMLQLLLLILD
jgi:hypothetical protein